MGMYESHARLLVQDCAQRLDRVIGPLDTVPRFSPVGQLIKSLISSRTRDTVSFPAYYRLEAQFGSVPALAQAAPGEIERVIADVTFADVKAERLAATLRQIRAERSDFKLGFLAREPLAAALAWLERLPGVGRKVAASTLNFSRLRLPVFVVDTHVLRVLQRLGVVRSKANATEASEAVTLAMHDWTADAFASFHSQLKLLGQSVCCWDKPDCRLCPLAARCVTARRG
jgi:endonuclease III